MSRRSLIGEALASVPSEPSATPTPETPATPRPNFTNKRLEAFGEAPRIAKRPPNPLKPAECSIWPGPPPDLSHLDEVRLPRLRH